MLEMVSDKITEMMHNFKPDTFSTVNNKRC